MHVDKTCEMSFKAWFPFGLFVPFVARFGFLLPVLVFLAPMFVFAFWCSSLLFVPWIRGPRHKKPSAGRASEAGNHFRENLQQTHFSVILPASGLISLLQSLTESNKLNFMME